MSYEADDNAVTARSVVFIRATWGQVSFSGSGFIAGRNDVITSSHLVYNAARGGLANKIEIFPSYDPDEPRTESFFPVRTTYFSDWDPDGDGLIYTGDGRPDTLAGSEIDLALLSMSVPLGDSYGWFNIDWNFSGTSVNVLGHPGVYGKNLTFDDGNVSRDPVDGIFENISLEVNPGNSGGPVYYDYGGGAYAIGAVSSSLAITSLGTHAYWLKSALAENDSLIGGTAVPSVPSVQVTRDGLTKTVPVERYSGPAAGIDWQYLGSSATSETISGTSQADFINGLAGSDIILGNAGNDILDGGTGSNFLTGGPGTDAFFTDARGGQVGWSTIVDFVAGIEQVSVFGYTPGVSRVFWEENYGAEGFKGATAFLDIDGSAQADRSGVDFALTFSGRAVGELGARYEMDGLLWFRPAV